MACAVSLTVALSGVSAWAQPSPVGLWRSVNDKTGAPQALVRISETAGVLNGRVERLLESDVDADAVCDKCVDDRKGQRILGLEILRGVRASGVPPRWEGGTILDADEGRIYRVRLQPIDGGRRLEVRGYIGVSLFGRTQTWIRVE
jgi:uncharacterized protein (DUF2147 family)